MIGVLARLFHLSVRIVEICWHVSLTPIVVMRFGKDAKADPRKKQYSSSSSESLAMYGLPGLASCDPNRQDSCLPIPLLPPSLTRVP